MSKCALAGIGWARAHDDDGDDDSNDDLQSKSAVIMSTNKKRHAKRRRQMRKRVHYLKSASVRHVYLKDRWRAEGCCHGKSGEDWMGGQT